MDAVVADGLLRDFGGGRRVGPVGFTVRAGELVALRGSNGAGKSTILRAVCGEERPDAGSVHVLGRAPRRAASWFRTEVGVLEDRSAFPDLTVREHLELVAVGHGLGAERAASVAAACRLADHADLSPHKLSSGLRQLFALAAILIPERTRLLVLDEPERHLDARARTWLAATLRARAATGTAVLTATHAPELAAAATRAVTLA
ncbi:ATP-binding cassette domain-containing protein [Actinocorallia sp. API 0066]|uniref:ABC transporter ATP-binding protein n=1 Tax=Actinocorallia sp. API 0066 TaxID=2896846 RepID=UPI001E5E01FD|nr:ATP-binding cassette domain-containing protein [Actinocorallia sp. API 0066]MCD0447626.1 ATP-binding cassette domain-containing protein [Actinocorallia sp. API 0066]